MNRPSEAERAAWFRSANTTVASQVGAGAPAPFAPVKALFCASVLTGLVVASVLLEGVVLLGDAVEAHLRG